MVLPWKVKYSRRSVASHARNKVEVRCVLVDRDRLRKIAALGTPLRAGPEEGEESEGEDPAYGVQTLPRAQEQTKTPSFYKVLIHNDDFTPRDFVVHVLQRFFKKDEPSATQLMLTIHHKGVGIAGVYTFEIAETKAYQVNEYAKQHRYPLRTTVEKDE